MAIHLETAWDILEHLGDVLAHLALRAVASRRGARWGLVENRCARQMLREVAARLLVFCPRRLAFGLIWRGRCGRCRGFRLRFSCGLRRLELFELQLELCDLALDALR